MLIPFGVFSAGAGGNGGAAGSFDLISTTLITSNTAAVTFDVSTYASTYKHLQIRTTGRSSFSDTNSDYGIRFNSDTASNYNTHSLNGNGSVVSSSSASGTNISVYYPMTAATEGASQFATAVIDILDAFSSTKNKTVRYMSGNASSSYKRLALGSGLWRSTSAITSITLTDIYGNFANGSRFSIYGIRG